MSMFNPGDEVLIVSLFRPDADELVWACHLCPTFTDGLGVAGELIAEINKADNALLGMFDDEELARDLAEGMAKATVHGTRFREVLDDRDVPATLNVCKSKLFPMPKASNVGGAL
jgi:hypothetical protein